MRLMKVFSNKPKACASHLLCCSVFVIVMCLLFSFCHPSAVFHFAHYLSLIENCFLIPNIIIKPADKNLGPVVMDRSWYMDECRRQLQDTHFYGKVSQVPFQNIYKQLRELSFAFMFYCSLRLLVFVSFYSFFFLVFLFCFCSCFCACFCACFVLALVFMLVLNCFTSLFTLCFSVC